MKKRYQRILNILAAASAPLSIGAIKAAVDGISESTHTETLIAMDLRVLEDQDLVVGNKDRMFTVTPVGRQESLSESTVPEGRTSRSEQQASI